MMLYTLNLQRAVCQLYLNETGEKKKSTSCSILLDKNIYLYICMLLASSMHM